MKKMELQQDIINEALVALGLIKLGEGWYVAAGTLWLKPCVRLRDLHRQEVVGLSGRGPGFHDCKEKMLNCLGCYLKVTCSFISCLSKPVLFLLAANSPPAVNSAGEGGVETQSWLHPCNKFQISSLAVVVALCGSWWVPCCKKVMQIWEPWVYWSVNLCFVPQLAKCLRWFFFWEDFGLKGSETRPCCSGLMCSVTDWLAVLLQDVHLLEPATVVWPH